MWEMEQMKNKYRLDLNFLLSIDINIECSTYFIFHMFFIRFENGQKNLSDWLKNFLFHSFLNLKNKLLSVFHFPYVFSRFKNGTNFIRDLLTNFLFDTHLKVENGTGLVHKIATRWLETLQFDLFMCAIYL